jgi:hypothetical protein
MIAANKRALLERRQGPRMTNVGKNAGNGMKRRGLIELRIRRAHAEDAEEDEGKTAGPHSATSRANSGL